MVGRGAGEGVVPNSNAITERSQAKTQYLDGTRTIGHRFGPGSPATKVDNNEL